MNALAGEVRSQWRGQLDESGSNLDGHTSPVHGAHAYTNVLHAFGGDVGCGGLEGGPAVVFVSVLRKRTFDGKCDLHDTRRNSVDANTSGCLLLGESASESHNRTLGGRVVDLGRIAHVAKYRSAVDNVVAALHVL